MIRVGRRAAAGALLGALLASRPALGWYFPEHSLLTQDGLGHLPAEALEQFGAVLGEIGHGVCPDASASLLTPGLACVPYTTLPALAGDHSVAPSQLLHLLEGVGLRIVRAASAQLEAAARFTRDELSRGGDAESRLDTDRARNQSVRELDLKLIALDPGYVSRAGRSCTHFVRAEQSLAEQLGVVVRGDLDHALGQVVVHHFAALRAARAAQAAPSETARELRRQALMEHAFSLHFLQDAFAAGHLVVGRDLCTPERASARKQKHDYYCRFGVAVTRALAFGSCVGRGGSSEEREWCWVTQGDGYLPLDFDAVQRRNVARAVAQAQALFVLALTPAAVARAWPADVRRQLGQLLDPAPWYTLDPGRVSAWLEHGAPFRGRAGARAFEAERNRAVFEGVLIALERLERVPFGACNVSSGRQQALCRGLPSELVVGVDRPCVSASLPLDPELKADPASPRICPTGDQVLLLGDPRVSLLRPLLSAWPAPQAPAATLTAGSSFAHGVAYQVFVLGGGGVRTGPSPVLPLLAGVGAGISYRAEGALPGTDNRAVAELNLGMLQGSQVPLAGGIDPVTWRYRGDAFAELRLPIVSDLLALGYLKIGSWLGSDLAWASVALSRVRVLSGARVVLAVDDAPSWRGFDLELLGFLRQDPDSEFRATTFVAPTEVRLRLGWLRDAWLGPRMHPTVTLEASGGFSRFF